MVPDGLPSQQELLIVSKVLPGPEEGPGQWPFTPTAVCSRFVHPLAWISGASAIFTLPLSRPFLCCISPLAPTQGSCNGPSQRRPDPLAQSQWGRGDAQAWAEGQRLASEGCTVWMRRRVAILGAQRGAHSPRFLLPRLHRSYPAAERYLPTLDVVVIEQQPSKLLVAFTHLCGVVQVPVDAQVSVDAETNQSLGCIYTHARAHTSIIVVQSTHDDNATQGVCARVCVGPCACLQMQACYCSSRH